MLIAVAVGALVGVLQGGLATKLTLSPIIITLGFYTAVRGLVFVVSDGDVKSRFGDAFRGIGRADFPATSIRDAGVHRRRSCSSSPGSFHTRTKWGRHVVSLGVNAEAARRAGISVNRLPWILYAVDRRLRGSRRHDPGVAARRRSADAR